MNIFEMLFRLLVIFIWVCLWSVSLIFAQNRNIEEIEIVTREQRWSNETMRMSEHQWYDWWKENNNAYNARLQTGWPTGNKEFINNKLKREKYYISNKRLQNYYPNDIDVQEYWLSDRWYALDQVVLTEDDKELWRPLTYKDNKKKIIIHHTAWNKAKDIDEWIQVMQNLAVQHSFSNGRWDIWYHFLIDDDGNIYEWRAWGEGIIWAHMKRNNTTSIWIALMGNFDIDEPTIKMQESLMRLTTALAWKYDIDPYWSTQLFQASENSPYLFATVHDSIVWHNEGAATECPWHNNEGIIEQLKLNVSSLIAFSRKQWSLDFSKITFHSEKTIKYSSDKNLAISLPLPWFWQVQCIIDHNWLEIDWCEQNQDEINITFNRTWYHWSGRVPLIINQWGDIHFFDLILLWQQDLDALLSHRKDVYSSTYWESWTKLQTNKITQEVAIWDIDDHVKSDVKVLLYELTTTFPEIQYICEQECVIRTDNETFINASMIKVISYLDRMEIEVDWESVSSQYLLIENNWIITVSNYWRASATWVSWNMFRGDIVMQNERMRHLQKWWIDARTVVNHVPFYDYLKGVIETKDQDHLEKIKAIFLATKNYTAYYLDWINVHPFVPADAWYTMIDDERIMQKYAGYWVEKTITKWYQAMRQLKDTRITYNNNIVILPYFHCWPGFTRSGNDYFWWTDTPRLRNVIDVSKCWDTSKFKWHWVWMSWSWAERLANAWVQYDEIINWYYVGTEVQ